MVLVLVEELWRIGQAASYRTERVVANTARQLSHGWLADASMETAKLLMRCGEAENVASDSACTLFGSSSSSSSSSTLAPPLPRSRFLSDYAASLRTTAYSLAHLPLQPSSSTPATACYRARVATLHCLLLLLRHRWRRRL